MFLEISQNSQENTCARDSFLVKLQAKFLRTSSLQNTSGRLLLQIDIPTWKSLPCQIVHKKYTQNSIQIKVTEKYLHQKNRNNEEVHSKPCQTSKTKLFPKVFNGEAIKDNHREITPSNINCSAYGKYEYAYLGNFRDSPRDSYTQKMT